jgi:hypothetical protein
MDQTPPSITRIAWILRIGASMEFIGHGMLGVKGVAAWTSYFAVVGIHREAALTLMPVVGFFDIAIGLAILAFPMRGVILYMAAWGLWTALLRPLAGESVWEAVERAGNFGALYALFLLIRGAGSRSWLKFDLEGNPSDGMQQHVCWALRLTTSLLLLGHGALGLLVRKPLLAMQYGHIGLQGSWVEPLVGALECALARAVLVQPGYGLLLAVVTWKLATEALSPIAGSPIWVFVEHGGSYAAPLALAFLVRVRDNRLPAPLRASPV